MVYLGTSIFSVCLVAALVLSVNAGRPSPCPDQFQYGGSNPGEWNGTLLLQSEFELSGTWIRVKFDIPIKQLIAHEFDVLNRSSDNSEYLIRNPHFTLKSRTPATVGITVKYDGDKVPNLMGYRLNAKTVCPEYSLLSNDLFLNDLKTKDFLSSVLEKPSPSPTKSDFKCGVVTSAPHPWQAAIYLNLIDQKEQYVCEATLISPQHVLTAAHCVTYRKTEVRLAPTLLSVNLGKNYEVSEIILYPGYKSLNLLNDLAILKLNSPVDDSVSPVCLSNQQRSESSVVYGYELGGEAKSVSTADVKEINGDECENRISKDGLTPLLGDNAFCASYVSENKPCIGDSGSGIASLNTSSKVWELRGIVSVGMTLQNKRDCNQDSTIFVVDTTKFFKWISASIL